MHQMINPITKYQTKLRQKVKTKTNQMFWAQVFYGAGLTIIVLGISLIIQKASSNIFLTAGVLLVVGAFLFFIANSLAPRE